MRSVVLRRVGRRLAPALLAPALTAGLVLPMGSPASATTAPAAGFAVSTGYTPGSGSFSRTVLRYAATQKGDRYRWGGTGPNAWDCSGYTQWVYKKVGKKLPRTSRQQRAATRYISSSQKRPGDLVFVHGSRGVYHVAIYAGKGYWWEATRPGRPLGKHKAWSKKVSYGRPR